MVTVIIVTTLAMVILGEWMAINYILVEYVCLFCIQCILALFLVVLCIVALVRKKQSILLSSLCLFGTLTLLSYPIVATLGNHYITISFWVICFYYLLSVIGSVLMLISPEKKKKQ